MTSHGYRFIINTNMWHQKFSQNRTKEQGQGAMRSSLTEHECDRISLTSGFGRLISFSSCNGSSSLSLSSWMVDGRNEETAIKDYRWDASKMSANEPTWREISHEIPQSPFPNEVEFPPACSPGPGSGSRAAQRGPSHSVKTMRGHYGHTLNRHNGIFPIGPFS